MRRLLFPHLALWVLGASVLRVAIVPPEICPPATAQQVHTAATAAGDWLVRGMREDARFVYGYDRDADVVNEAYNIVRHGGATVALYQLAAELDERFLAGAESALGWMLERVVDTGAGASAVANPRADASLGTTGFAIVALTLRREITGDPSYDDLMRRFGRFILGQRDGDALLSTWDWNTRIPVPGLYGPFATGEALWALAELDQVMPGEGWAEAALPTLRYLASGERERSEGYLARLPDHWAAYALEALDPDLLDAELVAYARRLASYFSMRLRFESQRTGEGINLLVRWYPGPPAGVGTAGEAMGALHTLAIREERLSDLASGMSDRLSCMAGFMLDRQVDVSEAQAGPRPDLTEAAWFYRDYTQVDGQQHVISSLIGAARAIEREP